MTESHALRSADPMLFLRYLDLVVAVSVGALSSVLASGVAGEVTTGPMAQLPLVLIPAYLVPLFVMLHGAWEGRHQRILPRAPVCQPTLSFGLIRLFA